MNCKTCYKSPCCCDDHIVSRQINISIPYGVGVGGAVESVNGQTGEVNLTTDDIPQGTTNLFNIQPDWNATSGGSSILNKPTKLSDFVNDLPPSASNLQEVTTGTDNNITSNTIQVTGVDNLNMVSGGLILGHSEGQSIIYNFVNGEGVSGINLTEDYIQLTLHTTGQAFSVKKETPEQAGGLFNSRVAGHDAINSNEFVTKSQLDANTPNLSDYIKKDTINLSNGQTTLKGEDYTINLDSQYGTLDISNNDVSNKSYLTASEFGLDDFTSGKGVYLTPDDIHLKGGSGDLFQNFNIDVGKFTYNDILTGRSITFPSFEVTSGTAKILPVSVNGVYANEFGEITIPTGDSVDLGSGLHEGTDGKINIGLDLTTAGTTNKGILGDITYLINGDIAAGVLKGIVMDTTDGVAITKQDGGFKVGVVNVYENTDIRIFKRYEDNSVQSIYFGDSGQGNSITITDSLNSKGLEYFEDYSANFTDHSLVTKKFVLDNAGGASDLAITAALGSISNNSIVVNNSTLGGSVTGDVEGLRMTHNTTDSYLFRYANGRQRGSIRFNDEFTAIRHSSTNESPQVILRSTGIVEILNATKVETGANIELITWGEGITLTSPNGTKFKITVADDGSLTTTQI